MQLDNGLIWYDRDPRRSFEDKVRAAAAAYEHRFKHAPTVCFVHPGDLPEDGAPEAPVQILAAPTVLRHHFFIGTAPSKRRRRQAA